MTIFDKVDFLLKSDFWKQCKDAYVSSNKEEL